jgi:DNA-binding NarL/FixJ family response regulator
LSAVKITVVEDHALMRDLLVRACRESVAASEVEGARDAATGLEVCRRMQPDLVILDLALPDGDGLDLVDELLSAAPGCRIIALSGYTDQFTLHRALRSRLHGFVDKNEQTIDQLNEGIRTVMAGDRYLSPVAREARESLRNDPDAFDKILSDREQNLLRLFGRGLSNDEIAGAVGLSELTVRNHRCRIMAKLGVRTSAELIRYALEKGFARAEPVRPR